MNRAQLDGAGEDQGSRPRRAAEAPPADPVTRRRPDTRSERLAKEMADCDGRDTYMLSV